MLPKLWALFVILNFSFFCASADPRISEANMYCGEYRTTPEQIIPTFVKVMDGLSRMVDKQNWGTYEYGSNPGPMFSLGQCMNDLSHKDCMSCFTEARTKLPRCLPSVGARVQLDGCFLRWDNYNFYQEAVDKRLDTRVCNSSLASAEDYLKLEFPVKVKQVITNVTETAVNNGGFAVGESKRGVVNVYALAQCLNTVNKTECRTCLEKAAAEVGQCLPGREGRALNTGCYLRYSNNKFYSLEEPPQEEDQSEGFFSLGAIIAVALAALAFLMISAFGGCLAYKRLSKRKKERANLCRISSTVTNSDLNFKYEKLENATEFFSASRKLGQGGAGSVYKGTLPDGTNIAVKRLFFNTRQWVDEFFNEVNLISGIKHKNLVQLLGCSIEGPESLLVYEYVANKSLDHVLFDRNNAQFLSWQQRFNIILGTAEGLAYLHGGCQIKIIHRDIKCSNVLLDEDMTAKIADFGLARMFSTDQSHISTGIAGTLGYMAPEYLVRGQLTEKADVYSFGVLVIEVVCGRKNTVFSSESGSVLQNVWTNFKSNSLPASVSRALKGDFPVQEASNVLQVGLLCTQASVSIRPTMAQVVQMLTDKDYPIPLPKQPPFMNASVVNPDTSSSISTSTGALDTPKSSTMSSFQSASPTGEISKEV